MRLCNVKLILKWLEAHSSWTVWCSHHNLHGGEQTLQLHTNTILPVRGILLRPSFELLNDQLITSHAFCKTSHFSCANRHNWISCICAQAWLCFYEQHHPYHDHHHLTFMRDAEKHFKHLSLPLALSRSLTHTHIHTPSRMPSIPCRSDKMQCRMTNIWRILSLVVSASLHQKQPSCWQTDGIT